MDKSDVVFSQYIRLRDGQCKRCGLQLEVNSKGLPINLQCSHFKGRIKEATRFHPENADALCNECHLYFTQHPREHYDWQVKIKGETVVHNIIQIAGSYKKKNRQAEYELWSAKVKEMIK